MAPVSTVGRTISIENIWCVCWVGSSWFVVHIKMLFQSDNEPGSFPRDEEKEEREKIFR